MLEAADLTCERGGKLLFRNLSFRLGDGDLLRIAGANGSGKTSLLRILCGLLEPAAGSVRWRGSPIRSLREDYAKNLVYLGHAAAVKDELTAAENLSITCRLAGSAPLGHDVRDALARFRVPQDKPVGRLSQGQRRRAALARLTLSEGLPLWLLDEPFSALDAEGIELLKNLLIEHQRRGGAVAFSTHQEPGIAAAKVIDLG
jgi:heme exporter protein A